MNTATLSNKKNLLIFFSSPHQDGFTKTALDIFLKRFGSDYNIETVNVFDTHIAPCIDCRACYKGSCPFNDDGMDSLLCKVGNADIIVCATPIYCNSPPTKFKAIFDRTQQLFVSKVILKKPRFINKKIGILISTAGSKDSFAVKSINAMFELFYKSLNADFVAHFSITQTDFIEKSDVVLDDELIKKVANILK